MSQKQQDDALINAYRRASASDADRPSAATRAAILAAAAAAARRNAPAANESRYRLRAVAGIAVLGIGLLLWRQTDYHPPGNAPAVTDEPVKLDISTTAEQRPSTEVAPEADRSAVENRAAKAARATGEVVNDTPLPQPSPASPVALPPAIVESTPPQLARNTDDNDLDEVRITGTRVQQPNNERTEAAVAALAAPPVGGAPPPLNSTALLRQYFPAQYQSEAPHSVWLVQNAAGEVLQSGELAADQRLADLAPQLAPALGARVLGPWQVQNVRNARGQLIELAIARLR